MEPYGERVIRAAANVMHARGQDGRDWLARAVLVATGKLDHTHLDPGATSDPPPSGHPRSSSADA